MCGLLILHIRIHPGSSSCRRTGICHLRVFFLTFIKELLEAVRHLAELAVEIEGNCGVRCCLHISRHHLTHDVAVHECELHPPCDEAGENECDQRIPFEQTEQKPDGDEYGNYHEDQPHNHLNHGQRRIFQQCLPVLRIDHNAVCRALECALFLIIKRPAETALVHVAERDFHEEFEQSGDRIHAGNKVQLACNLFNTALDLLDSTGDELIDCKVDVGCGKAFLDHFFAVIYLICRELSGSAGFCDYGDVAGFDKISHIVHQRKAHRRNHRKPDAEADDHAILAKQPANTHEQCQKNAVDEKRRRAKS